MSRNPKRSTLKMATRSLLLIVISQFAFLPTSAQTSDTPDSRLELVAETTVDEKALTFAVGPAAKFSQTVNGRTHQQTPLTTYRGYQYATYVDARRRICIARRKLPENSWDVIRFNDYRFKTNDSHNTSVIGICAKDGTIHLAFDHHATQLNYRVSKQDVANKPDSFKWNARLFGPVTHTLGSVSAAERVTYPRFFSAPNGNLMLFYRGVTSADGDGVIEEYDGDKHDWTQGLGKVIARDIGTYSFGGKVSERRCPYMNWLSYGGQRLHASWIWRDRFEKTNPRNQHDLCYAYSDDNGRTWFNSAGVQIGETGKSFIHLNTPGVVVAPIPSRRRLTNQNTHFVFDDGRVHVMLRHQLTPTSESRYQHYWRSLDGKWLHEELPFSGCRPKLIGDEDGSLVLVYSDEDDDDNELLQIAKGIPNDTKTAWQWSPLNIATPIAVCSEPLVDVNRWKSDNILSIYLQESPSRIKRTRSRKPVNGVPSPLKVLDFRISNPIVRPPAGRIAIVADGNSPDPDDIGATAVMFGLLKASGLNDRLVHLSHSCDLEPVARISADDELRRQKVLHQLCGEGISRFGPFKNLDRFLNCRTDQQAAIADLRKAIDRSSKNDPLWIIEAGEPDVIGFALKSAKSSAIPFVHVVSHHPANDDSGDFFKWQQILDFGVTEHQIGDQNVGLQTPIDKWDWAKQHSNSSMQWIWQQLAYAEQDGVVKFQTNKFDCSDAGMIYWWITGADKGGNKNSTPVEIRQMLE